MTQYVLRRVAHVIPLLILVSIISFFLIQLPPGDIAETFILERIQLGDYPDETEIRKIRERYLLDRPIYAQYLNWAVGFTRGDWGYSYLRGKSVRELIGERIVLSIVISVAGILFAYLVAIPFGIYSATHQYSVGDTAVSFAAFIGMATPNFLLALVLMFISVMVFGASSVGGLFSPQYIMEPWSLGKVVDFLKHLWMPMIIVGTAGAASKTRIMRGNLLDNLEQPFVDTARMKGLTERTVVNKHAVRASINPLISILGLTFPAMISGEVIVGEVMGLPTIGPMLLEALRAQDMYLAGAVIMILSVALIAGNLLADIALAWLDPRIRYR